MHDRLTRRFLMLLAAYGMAVSVAACGSGSDESADTSAPPAETTAVPLASTSLEFRPVLSSGPCEDGGEDGTSPGEDVLRASGDNVMCYRVGPVGVDGADIATATPVANAASGWAVEVTFADHAKDTVNTLFNSCFTGEPTCPAYEGGVGYVAIVLDGLVVSAPAVQGEDLASDTLTVSGQFTEAEATELAATLNL